MTKKLINQNDIYNKELLNLIDSDHVFSNNPIDRFKKKIKTFDKIKNQNKIQKLEKLKELINSIEDCKLKENSNKIILGSGNIDSPILLVGEAPGDMEDKYKKTFESEHDVLLKKMLKAINIEKENIYTTYVVNFLPPNERKPTTNEINRYSVFLKEHISIISPKLLILMGSTAMEALTGINNNISVERGKWKEIIIKDRSYDVMITFNPSYLLRKPENKKLSWEDLKKIKQKILELKINI